MKKCVLFSVLLAVSRAFGVELSNLTELPAENVVASQVNMEGASQQARYFNAGDWRGVVQTFCWLSRSDLDGIGIHISDEQKSFSWEAAASQKYTLIIQEVANNIPQEIVAQVEFSLSGENLIPDSWLYIDIDNLSLDSGAWYSFTLCPVDVKWSLRTFWNMAANGGYYEGRGSQWNVVDSGGALPKTDECGDQGDFAFFVRGAWPEIK